MLKELYKKINNGFIFDYEKSHFHTAEQEAFLDILKEPKDDIDLAYNRHLCKVFYHYPVWGNILFNIASFFVMPFFFVSFSLRGRSKGKKVVCPEPSGAIVCRRLKITYKDILPHELIEQYGTIAEFVAPEQNVQYITQPEKNILKQCINRHPFSFYFNFMVLLSLGEYRYLLDTYSPKAIIVYCFERDSSGPLLTRLCESCGVDNISFMHGDYIYSIDKAFLRFSKYYVWDEHYVRMFTNLKCDPNQFVIYIPDKLQGITKPRKNEDSYDYFATYYFGAESRERINGVAKAFEILKKRGLKCKIRPHPRFSDVSFLSEVFKDYCIEDPKNVSLAESLECSRYTVALNSTVLSQAYYSGKDIVIDDYSDKKRYKLLKERQYIMLSKPHKLFTELVADVSSEI